ncbi:unnamed protein product [Auanema sp. JU1783]|nr:unnamed protein product [Auanema sp. JU1783]
MPELYFDSIISTSDAFLKREKQALSRKARLVRRNLVKNSSSNASLRNGSSINPAQISLFSSSNFNTVSSEGISTRERKRKTNIVNITHQSAPADTSSSSAHLASKTESSEEVEWPSLYEYLEVEDCVFTELMQGLDINVEQLINIDEHTLLQYEGETVELGGETARYVKVMKDDDEIVILKVVPSTHKMSLMMEEKPMIKRSNMNETADHVSKLESKMVLPVISGKSSVSIRGRKCRRWNWDKDNYEDVVVSRVSKAGWNVKENSFWDWEDEWSNAKAICRKCDLKLDRRKEDNGASQIFSTPNPYVNSNNNLSDIPMSPSVESDQSGMLSDPVLFNECDGDEINTETLYESMNIDSSGLVDLGYIEDL